MKYIGSKQRYVADLLPIILAKHSYKQFYVEPFVGGANLISEVLYPNRVGADSNKYLIALLQAVQSGWRPPSNVTEIEYADMKDYPDKYPDYLVGFVGICCSFGGAWFNGYARGEDRNFADEGRRNLLAQANSLKGIKFVCCDYRKYTIPEKSTVYCDPPYVNTKGYMQKSFDTSSFWSWCDGLVNQGHTVFVSELQGPDHWDIVWEDTRQMALDHTNNFKTERLFHRV